ncbi:MAG: LPXTG cell wall anchor domain-containing protein [Clostridiaceae bacterium]|nr:LPXTG cell wall anchor domain-containing protein [Clostridiaceae bacterium]
MIPTGEQNNTVFAWGLILMGLGWILTTQRRRFRKGNED